jgi:enoyl-CoA hydratase/carnithine racemase
MTDPAAQMTTEETILLRQDEDGVCTLTLNRPRQYNALSEEMLHQLQLSLRQVAQDESVRVVVLAGAGRAFCAGHDLKQMRANPRQSYYEDLFAQCSEVMLSIQRLPQPVVARVHGIATAAGCQLVASCDLAVAAEDARFAVSGVKLGLFCSTPGVALSRNLSRKQAFEMLITGDFVDAKTARAYGLVNRVVETARLDDEIANLAASIKAKSPVAVKIGKEMFYQQIEKNLEDAYGFAARVMACNMMAEDACEGIDAFTEKRTPQWKGR